MSTAFTWLFTRVKSSVFNRKKRVGTQERHKDSNTVSLFTLCLIPCNMKTNTGLRQMEQEKEPQPNRENPTTDHTPLTFYCCFYPPVQPGVGKKPAVCNQNENVIIPLDCSTHSPLEPSDCREDDGKWAGGCCFILTTVRNRNIALQGWVTLNILILSVLWQETPHGENLPADLDGTTVKWKPQKVIWSTSASPPPPPPPT